MTEIDPGLAVWESLRAAPRDEVAPREPSLDDWPGVADPDGLRAQLVDWLGQYANAGTRRTYAYALGLPVAWVDALGGVGRDTVPTDTVPRTPPPAPRPPARPPQPPRPPRAVRPAPDERSDPWSTSGHATSPPPCGDGPVTDVVSSWA